MKNILFDLGNVIVKLDTESIKRTFQKYTQLSFDEFYKENTSTFDRFETGHISEKDFVENITNKGFPKDKVIPTWNSMVLGIPPQRIKFLKSIQNQYNIYFYSNTNSLHIKHLDQLLKKDGFSMSEFRNLFVNSWCSHEIGFRKPNREGFDYIIQKTGINPSETLFIDDSKSYLEGAKLVGLQTARHPANQEIQDVFMQYLGAQNY